ncbi:MAG TPA: aldehyde dehydrogenase (NADP(+)) [Cyclobacteriaceae bacterium]|nr:aldehyde dehydrogenase (NADP(+)) [Cyclobacteriaceae bacterium]
MIEGKQIIGFELVAEGKENFYSFNPATGENMEYRFRKATSKEVTRACDKAAMAFQVYRKKSGIEKAIFLEAIAEEINALGDELIDVCCKETALPKGRIEGERTRTVNQLKLFASLLREGSWVDARIETADSGRVPIPKPDIRYMEIGLGPVVVFGASNFPLAFSVAGGDTASALAAGCPVVVKVHSAHPATGELVGRAILKAAQLTNMPDGVFSLLHGDGKDVGIQLVKHPAIKAVGLTGSFTAGKALFHAAVNREVPIPVYAEMGSTNPVFILPGAMREHGKKIASAFATSVTLGVGQFCTNPGILIHESITGANEFTEHLEEEFKKTSGGVMLTETIYKSYLNGIAHHSQFDGVETLASGADSNQNLTAKPFLFKTTANTYAGIADLAEEIFGPASLIVEASSREEILSLATNLSGHLTATVHGTDADLSAYKDLIDILEQKVGRVVVNGFPTGVEVCSAMVHGGPFPATTDGRSTSVGTAAIHRFTRPVCYQGMPDALLPEELKNANPLKLWRLVNNTQTQQRIE